jgi:hypothetical protein
MKTLRAEQIFLSAVTIGELQAGGELTRRNDTAKALEIEAWLTMVEASFAVAHELGMLSGMGAANGGEEATLDGRRNDCRHGPGSRLGCGHAKTSETSGSFR